MADERDYIGFDPVLWIERLLEVNRTSQFTAEQKTTITCALFDLRAALTAGNQTPTRGEVMDAAIKTKWTEALRSGKYAQCMGQLRNEDGFCCLGVLATEMQMEIDGEGHGARMSPKREFSYGPIWELVSEGRARTLASMNDNGASFVQIADEIDRAEASHSSQKRGGE